MYTTEISVWLLWISVDILVLKEEKLIVNELALLCLNQRHLHALMERLIQTIILLILVQQ